MQKRYKILIIFTGIVCVFLLARFVFFEEAFNRWGRGVNRVQEWEDEYRKKNPDATQEDIDDSFKSSIKNLEEWEKNYKKEHPDANEEEIQQAFKDTFDQNQN